MPQIALSIIEPLSLQMLEQFLFQAIHNGDLNNLRQLISANNITPKFKFSTGNMLDSLLHHAVILQPEFLYKYEKRPDSFLQQTNTSDANAIIRFLLVEFKVNPNQGNFAGITPLHTAMTKCNLDIVHLLLEYGANPSQQDQEGNTPFHEFAYNIKRFQNNHFTKECLLSLIKAGVDRNIKNHKGKTAEDIEPGMTMIIDNHLGMTEQYSTQFRL